MITRFYWLLLLATMSSAQELTLDQANRLAALPLKCLQQEYPNKLSQVLANPSELQIPAQLHPAFYGCFDWHSSVHGHWSLVWLLKKFPNMEARTRILQILSANLSKENIHAEVAYFGKPHEKSYERTYGWAWLLKLQQELNTATDPQLNSLAANLQSLTDVLVSRYIEFLPKLVYPVRAGTHTNTAFGMSFAYDYAVQANHSQLQQIIRENARRLFLNDRNCPFDWEPSGTDFLSPCLEEAALMMRVLPEAEFGKWTDSFAPEMSKPSFSPALAQVSDRTDGHLVHLDGLNFSRAWNFYAIARAYSGKFAHLNAIADQHFTAALGSIVDGNYEGEHWLASFALQAFAEKYR